MTIRQPGLYRLANDRVATVTAILPDKVIGSILRANGDQILYSWRLDGTPVAGLAEWAIAEQLHSYPAA